MMTSYKQIKVSQSCWLLMQLENDFKDITISFYEGDYDEGLEKLNTLISRLPGHRSLPALLVNKAIFHSQLSDDEEAEAALEQALELNPHCYLAYFNLASIQIRNNQDEAAYQNLCSTLSVMYLIKGKMTKSLSEVNKSIEMAENNLEARILKSLILTSSDRLEEGRTEILKALSYNPGNLILRNVALSICKKIDPQATLPECSQKPTIAFSRRLKSQRQLSETQDQIQAINKKISQFNILYKELNNSFGGVTQKVPKETSFQNNLQTFMLEKSRVSQKSNHQHKSMIQMLEDDDFFADSSNFEQEKVKSDALVTAESQIKMGFDSHVKGFEIIEENSSKQEFSMDSIQEKEVGRTNIYPLKQGNSKISINILNFSFFRVEDFPPLNNVYCLLSYNNQKLTTPFVLCQQGSCVWNKSFINIALSPQPSSLKLKLYNKVKSSIRDLLLGDFQVVINTADLLRLPLYDRKEEQIGNLLVHLQIEL